MKPFIKTGLFAFFTAIFFCSPHLSNSTEIQSTWEVRCKELKSKHLANPRVDVLFSQPPELVEIKDVWTLKWEDIDILVPAGIKMTDVFISMGYSSACEILLIADNGMKILAGVLPDLSTDDIFKRLDFENDTIEPPPDGRSLTRQIYGGPVRISKISMFGFAITPENLICHDKNDIEEAEISIALILKNIESPGKLMSAHKNVGAYKGWIEKQRSNKQFEYILNIIPDSGKELLHQVSYIIPDESVYKDLPFQVGTMDKQKIKKPPEWLDALNRALQNKTEYTWKEYAKTAQKKGISKKSITRTLQNLNIN